MVHAPHAASRSTPPRSSVPTRLRATNGTAPSVVKPQVLAGKTVGIVGGGPGGMLCAAHLAGLGAAVEVFERRNNGPKGQPPPAGWNIMLSSIARQAIDSAGISSDFGPMWRCALQRCASCVQLLQALLSNLARAMLVLGSATPPHSSGSAHCWSWAATNPCSHVHVCVCLCCAICSLL